MSPRFTGNLGRGSARAHCQATRIDDQSFLNHEQYKAMCDDSRRIADWIVNDSGGRLCVDCIEFRNSWRGTGECRRGVDDDMPPTKIYRLDAPACKAGFMSKGDR